jgi:ribosomal protein S24E
VAGASGLDLRFVLLVLFV